MSSSPAHSHSHTAHLLQVIRWESFSSDFGPEGGVGTPEFWSEYARYEFLSSFASPRHCLMQLICLHRDHMRELPPSSLTCLQLHDTDHVSPDWNRQNGSSGRYQQPQYTPTFLCAMCDTIFCSLHPSPLRCNRRSRRALARFGCAAPACRGCIYNANAEQRQHARSSGTLARYDDASACVTRAVAGDSGRKSCRHDHGGQGVALAASAKNPAAPCRNISTWISTALFWSRSA